MGNSYRVQLILLWQIVLGISYAYKTVYIGLPFFNIQIDTRKIPMEFFKFHNYIRNK